MPHRGLRVADGRRAVAARSRPLSRAGRRLPRTVFIDLETTGLSGGAGTVAFLVGCGYFDLGAFQVRQFLLTSYAAERALLDAVAEFFDDARSDRHLQRQDVRRAGDGDALVFHRMEMPLDGVPHFDMLHPARRLWSGRAGAPVTTAAAGCRRSNVCCSTCSASATCRASRFRRASSGSCAAAIRVRSSRCSSTTGSISCRWRRSRHGPRGSRRRRQRCRDEPEALALGRVYERCGMLAAGRGLLSRARCARRRIDVRAEALYRLGLRLRRERRFGEAAACWRDLLDLAAVARAARHAARGAARVRGRSAGDTPRASRPRLSPRGSWRCSRSRKRAGPAARSAGLRHRLARLERKLAQAEPAGTARAQLFS